MARENSELDDSTPLHERPRAKALSALREAKFALDRANRLGCAQLEREEERELREMIIRLGEISDNLRPETENRGLPDGIDNYAELYDIDRTEPETAPHIE